MLHKFTDDQIEALRRLRERDHGQPVTRQEAEDMAYQLFALHEWMQDLMRSGRIDHLTPPLDMGDVLEDSA